jgi:hypothetical protein
VPEALPLTPAPSVAPPTLVGVPARDGMPARAANLALLVFALVSLAVWMSIGQDDEIEVGSLVYWLMIVPAALLPLPDAAAMWRNLTGSAWALLAMLVLGGAWQLARGDARAAVQLALLVWVLAWVSRQRATISVRQVAWLFTAIVLAGTVVDAMTDINRWGLLPGRTADEYGIWRVSFFPNIANTAMLSLFVLLLLTRNIRHARRHSVVFVLACYFLLFSFVRTAIVGAAMYLVLRWWFERPSGPRGRRMAWIAGFVAIGVNLLIASSAVGLAVAQDAPLLSRLLLRGQTGMTPDEIYEQLYRPWLWGQHLWIFADSPLLMGQGSFEFAALQTNELIEGHPGVGSEALPMRLLATYGLAGMLFPLFLFGRLRHLARADDRWACAAFPTVVLLMMNWGSVFHPSNAFFAFFLLIATRGSRGVIDER